MKKRPPAKRKVVPLSIAPTPAPEKPKPAEPAIDSIILALNDDPVLRRMAITWRLVRPNVRTRDVSIREWARVAALSETEVSRRFELLTKSGLCRRRGKKHSLHPDAEKFLTAMAYSIFPRRKA